MSITVQNLNDPVECILDAESLGHRTLGLVMDPFDVAAQLPARRGAPAANARLMRVKNLTLDSARVWVTVLLSWSGSLR
jgi:hypothetical protein